MGQDTSESQLADINDLLDEHARLAYHSARTTDQGNGPRPCQFQPYRGPTSETIRVETAPGAFTEMIIELPLVTSATIEEAAG